MPTSSHPRPSGPAGGRALLVYVAGWALTGVIVAAALLVVLNRGGDEAVSLPPVRETELRLAAEEAGCELRSGARRPRADEPAVQGPAGRPVAAGFYEDGQSERSLVAAMRRGVIVISYRRDVPDKLRDQLRVVQKAVPEGTVVVPNERMRFAIAVTAWRRLLGCRRAGTKTLDAMRLFRGRYIGSGPDSPR